MLTIYNTLAKRKEAFEPLHPGKVGMYACGPTVYDYIHIGNLRAYVFSDTLRRLLEHEGYEVRLIRNITDVGHMTDDAIAQGDSGEDKLEKKARAEQKSPAEIAAFYEDYFHRAEEAINIIPAHFYPAATAHIPHMIRMIEDLIRKGCAYTVNGNVFFDVTSFPSYGKLSGNTLENLKVGARLEAHPDKKNPWDFALWLKAPAEHTMRWPSPWSEGYPGWHIECSAMSLEYLGDTLDIHTGGEDNIFPHHEAEIAQSECTTGKPFVRYWLHNRHLKIDGEKMSKSQGNFYTIEDIVEKGYSPMDLRLLFLSAHYRSQMNFTWDAIAQAKKNRETLFALVHRLESAPPMTGPDLASPIRETWLAALRDDLNTPLALAALLEFVRLTNGSLDRKELFDARQAIAFLKEALLLFGLKTVKVSIPKEVQVLAAAREAARQEKNFARSDELRDKLLSIGWVTEDTPEGSKLKKK